MVHVMLVGNVCQALPKGVEHLTKCGFVEQTRAGEAIVAPGPVATVTLRPRERVLFSSNRDANPFFHLYEAVWMLGGRDDAAPLNYFVKIFGSSYGEPTGEVHGAYGKRWRSAFGFDQLDAVVKKLRGDPASRQCVLQMWDCTTEYVGHGRVEDGHRDLTGNWRDRPCNTQIFLRVRKSGATGFSAHPPWKHGPQDAHYVLDICVLCRSNDILWGAHGANAVHFSVLHEYLAARIGVEMGTMTQFSWNYHAYVSELIRLCGRVKSQHRQDIHMDSVSLWLDDNRYSEVFLDATAKAMPMFDQPREIDSDVREALAWFDRGAFARDPIFATSNKWFERTWARALVAHKMHREGYDAAEVVAQAEGIEALDWRTACVEWLRRRAK